MPLYWNPNTIRNFVVLSRPTLSQSRSVKHALHIYHSERFMLTGVLQDKKACWIRLESTASTEWSTQKLCNSVELNEILQDIMKSEKPRLQ